MNLFNMSIVLTLLLLTMPIVATALNLDKKPTTLITL